ncbi:general stress protein [Planococcus shixiaomingii]|uniref:general stress protein n=1 Tax=Planococcus shixiaomingii TaxID=3058393 RepID=UPI002639920C|nr:general stress protein [Planococcus sp. N022]WKA53778.1 general stress protein [Planococcus sp. N022]
MDRSNYEYQMLYSQEELINKIKELKSRGYHEGDLHVLVNDSSVINLVDDQSDVHTHEGSSMGSKFKSMFSGEDAVRTELGKLDLDEATKDAYQRDLENGAILLYTDSSPQGGGSGTSSTVAGDTKVIRSDEVGRNTAIAPFGRDVERDDLKHNDAKIEDKDVTSNASGDRYSNEIYTSEVSREDQHGNAGYGNEMKDSRIKGENIHPTGGAMPKDEGAVEEKTMDHEPGLQSTEGQDNLNREDGINRRQDEQSPGVDPNLGPAPFGRDSEEEHLLNNQRDDYDQGQNTRSGRRLEDKIDKKNDIPPTSKLF